VRVYVGSVLLYVGFFVLVWLILQLIFVVRTSASDCLEDRLRKTYNVPSRTLNLTHSLTPAVVGHVLQEGVQEVGVWGERWRDPQRDDV